MWEEVIKEQQAIARQTAQGIKKRLIILVSSCHSCRLVVKCMKRKRK
jgi:hypothetical protein